MKILLDTDVVSQLTKDVPNAKAHTWLRVAIDEDLSDAFAAIVVLSSRLNVGVDQTK